MPKERETEGNEEMGGGLSKPEGKAMGSRSETASTDCSNRSKYRNDVNKLTLVNSTNQETDLPNIRDFDRWGGVKYRVRNQQCQVLIFFSSKIQTGRHQLVLQIVNLDTIQAKAEEIG